MMAIGNEQHLAISDSQVLILNVSLEGTSAITACSIMTSPLLDTHSVCIRDHKI